MAAAGGHDFLCTVPGAAVAGGTWLVHQPGVLVARPHAYAGTSQEHADNFAAISHAHNLSKAMPALQ